MRDIERREDIEYLVDQFYRKVLKDKLIQHFFIDIVKLDWEIHIPTMYNFWESVLLGNAVYRGNAMEKHIKLHQKQGLDSVHFERWLSLWRETIESNFQGPTASKAIEKARQIGMLIQHKLGA
jgi:hemoglobin